MNFLYSGQIPVENEKNLIENLARVFGFAENLKIVGSNPVKGQAHDMFSRIFRIRIYKFFLPNIMQYLFWFFICSKLRKKMPCLTHKEFVFIFYWKILLKKFVDLFSENSWKHVVSSIEVKEEFVIKLKTEIKTEEQAASKESFDRNEETGMDFITSEEFDKNLKNASNFVNLYVLSIYQ